MPRALVHSTPATQPDTNLPTELEMPTTEINNEASEDDSPDCIAIYKDD